MNSKKPPLVKDFPTWHRLKTKLDASEPSLQGYKERDVWWLSMGHNVGIEEDGKGIHFARPVLVIKGFSRRQFWGIPLSTTEKTGKYYHKFVMNGEVSTVLISQMRVFDTNRMISKMGMMNQKDFARIKFEIIGLLSTPKK